MARWIVAVMVSAPLIFDASPVVQLLRERSAKKASGAWAVVIGRIYNELARSLADGLGNT
jgi:hypothetical protein